MLITGHRYSYAIYTGDGSTAVFTVPFPFIDRQYVHVSVDGADLPRSSIEWLSDASIRITPAPKAKSRVRIQRITEKSQPLVDFSDGSVLTEDDLDMNTAQLLHLVQEAWDIAYNLEEMLGQGMDLGLFYQMQQLLWLIYDFLGRTESGTGGVGGGPDAPGVIYCAGAKDPSPFELMSCNGAGEDAGAGEGRIIITGYDAYGDGNNGVAILGYNKIAANERTIKAY